MQPQIIFPAYQDVAGSCSGFWSVHEPSVNHVCLKMADLHVMQCQPGHASANTVRFIHRTWLWYRISNISHQKQVYIVFYSMSPTVQGMFQPIPSPMACQPSSATLGQFLLVWYKTFTSHNHHCCVHNQVYVCMHVCMYICVCSTIHVGNKCTLNMYSAGLPELNQSGRWQKLV